MNRPAAPILHLATLLLAVSTLPAAAVAAKAAPPTAASASAPRDGGFRLPADIRPTSEDVDRKSVV